MIARTKLPQILPKLKPLALATAIALAGCAKDDPQQFISEGKALFEKGDMDGARVQYKNALQINPKLVEAYYGLALLDEKKPDFQSMGKNLAEVIALDPTHVNAHVKMGFFLIGELDKAKEQAAIALKLDPENTDAVLLDARIKFTEKNMTEALKLIDRILAKNPSHPDALWLQASISLFDKRYDDALAALNQGLEVHPDNMGLGRLKIKTHMMQQKADEVVSDYEELILKNPADKTLLNEFVLILAQIGKYDRAEQALRDAVEKDPGDVQLKLSLVDFVEQRDASRAESVLKEYLRSTPDDIKLKGRLAGYYIGHTRYDDAKLILQEIVAGDEKGKEGLTAKLHLAEIALAQNDKARAESLVQEILAVDGNNSGALLFRAGTSLAKQDFDGAISDLRIVLRDRPNSDQAMVMMGQVYALKGEPEVAHSHWRKALEVNPNNLTALTPLATAYLKSGDASQAEELLNKSLKKAPGNQAILELLVEVKAAKKDWSAAEAAVAELKKLPKADIVAQMLSGMLAASQGKHDQALQAYKGVLSQKPDAQEALVAMAKSYEAAGKRSEFFDFMKRFIKDHPENTIAYNTLGLAYAADKKWDEAAKALQDALKVDPKSVATYKMLAGVLTRQGKDAQVADWLHKGLENLPDNPELAMELAKYYERRKDFDAAISAYDGLLEKFPGNDEVANNLAYLLVDSNPDSVTLARALGLVERFKDSKNPYFLDTYGWVLFKLGKAAESLAVFKKAVAAVPDNPDFHYHLGEAHYGVGDHVASKDELEKSLALAQQRGILDGMERAKELLKQVNKS